MIGDQPDQDTATAADTGLAALHTAVANNRVADLPGASTAALATLLHSLSYTIRTLVAILPSVAHDLPPRGPDEPLPVDGLGPYGLGARNEVSGTAVPALDLA